MPGTILGRPPAQILALVLAVFNALIVFGVIHLDPTQADQQVAAVDTLAAIVIAVIANSPFTDHAALAAQPK